MSGPSTRGGKRGKKPIKLKPSKTGGQFYQSDRARKSMRSSMGDDALGKRIDRALTDEMLAGKISPKRAGKIDGSIFVDRVHDAYWEDDGMDKPRGMKKGGAVRGYKCGGKVKGYEDGGAVCRGGRSAMGGTKFRGVR